MLSLFLTHLQGYRKDAVKAPILIILEVICELLLPLIMAEIVDVAIPAGDVGYIFKLGAMMLVLAVAAMFCGVMSAEEVLKFHQVPYDNLFPVYPNCRYTLPDFTLDTFQAKHNPNGGGRFLPDGLTDIYSKLGLQGHARCDQLGSIESFDFMITTPSHFSVLMASGRVIWDDLFEVCKQKAPNVLLRQAGVREAGGSMTAGKQVDPPVLAELLAKYHAQVVFPFHHDVMLARWGKEKTSEYFAQVDEELRKLEPSSVLIDPEAWKWYDIGIDVSVE